MSKERLPRILFTSPQLSHPPIGGPNLRIENSIKALSLVSELHLVSQKSLQNMGGPAAVSFYQHYCKTVQVSPRDAQIRILNYFRRAINYIPRRLINRILLPIQPDQVVNYEYLLRRARFVNADVIWLGYGNISYEILRYFKTHTNYKVVLDTDSVWSRYVLRGLPFVKDREEYKRIEAKGCSKEEEERWGTALADVTTAVSEIDAEYYRRIAKHREQVQLFSNVIDLESYAVVPPAVKGMGHPCCYLAGSFWPNSPMDDAARWIIQEVLPLVRQVVPRVHLYIVGQGSRETLADIYDPGITVLGMLPSVLPYLCHVDVAVVPLRFESGTRFKILEAGACNIPVVSTTLGAEGLPVVHETHLLIADTPEQFAGSIVRLLSNRPLAVSMAANLKSLVAQRNSVASLAKEARTILRYLQRT